MKSGRSFSILVSFALLASALVIVSAPAGADHTADPGSVTIAGSLQDELGCSGDWQPDCADTYIAYDSEDDVWQGTLTIPAGTFEYKAALNNSWDEAYGSGGDNIVLDLAAGTDVKFYYDHKSHWITDDVNSVIATAAGDFQSELGCPGDWQPDCLRSWLQDLDGDGIYEFETGDIPTGAYEFKVALDEAWDVAHPATNVPFTVATAGEIVTISYDTATGDVTVTVEAPPPPGPASVTIAGSLQDELGCPGDWQPDCASTHLVYDFDDDVWQGVFTLPAGSFEYKAALEDSWDENYGAGAVRDGANIGLDTGSGGDVKFYYDHKSHWVTDNVNSVIATAVGSFQAGLGCPGDWQPECLRSWMQDIDDDGIYVFATDEIPAGSYEGKVALDEGWATAHPASNLPFTVEADGDIVTFSYDSGTDDVTIDVGSSGLEPGDELLVRAPLRTSAADDTMYFVMPDRFINGDPSNDAGGDLSGDPLVNGLLPTDKGYFHGGDIAGLEANLDYLNSLGVTAIWMTPQFTNNAVQGDGTIAGSTAGYHGYWQIDYNEIDPHFGTNAEMNSLVTSAHALGIKVFFDIVANHTGDVVSYEEGVFTYRDKDDYPYTDATGVEFDDRDYAGTGTFPDLDAATSFPYTPTFIDPGDDTAKAPAWLNDPIYYHNRGNSTFTGENSLYGDFFGLDDLFTEHPVVQDGLIDIFKGMITDFDIDGFRVDTVKHVNDEFWEVFVPEIESHASSLGKPDFSVFGEVFSSDPAFASRYTTELDFPAILDFGFAEASRNFAASSAATDQLRDRFADDDYFTDENSNASFMPKFTGNHDVGRIGYFIDIANP
ncbi:MAG: alpha-amylase family glycosyl hydrolase, partial [Actinomycetia bacterium]|nr:alpha-amylase family glycosyl hydrolase [Actinomycetes bacterium]